MNEAARSMAECAASDMTLTEPVKMPTTSFISTSNELETMESAAAPRFVLIFLPQKPKDPRSIV